MRKFTYKSVLSDNSLFLSFVNVFIISLRAACGERFVVYPCVDMKAIEWVRDPNFCDQYYICHFGQPLAMPACPKGQVWATAAMNCVPVGSRWDDCHSDTSFTKRPKKEDRSNSLSKVLQYTRSEKPDHTQHSKKRIYQDRRGSTSPRYRITEGRQQNRKYDRNDVKEHNFVQSQLSTEKTFYTKTNIPQVLKKDTFRKSSKRVPDVEEKSFYPTSSTSPSYFTLPRTPQTTKKTLAIFKEGNRRNRGPYREKPARRRGERKRRPQQQHSPDEIELRCLENPGILLPHPKNCHWYYNCSLGNLDDTTGTDDVEIINDDNRTGFIRLQPYRVRRAGTFVWECRYPQLFDNVTHKCREFINVQCGSRFEPVDQCEYSQRECHSGRCDPCEKRFGRCRDKENGIYPLQTTNWSPVFMTCYQSRNIAQDECQAPSPIFSPEILDCVSLFEVPKVNGGLQPDCSTRPDGYYPDEQGRCAIFFRCSLGRFRGYDECPPSSVFDPAIPACQPYSVASRPCGEGQAPLCGGKFDGLYADPFGRCTLYFQCKNGAFQRYYSCDDGIFDPLTQTCVISAEQTLRPCGLKPSPCETLPTGVYPDQETGCNNFIECHHGIIVTNGTCERGRVFSAISGRCDVPENTPPPCGVANTCLGRPDGRYPALNRGCSFFFECYHGEFISLRRCTAVDGGFFFNPATGRCDYPQNICPPCGYRWWGCAQEYRI